MGKNKKPKIQTEEPNLMMELCRVIMENHAGYNDDGTPYDGQRVSYVEGNSMFQDVKGPKDFEYHPFQPKRPVYQGGHEMFQDIKSPEDFRRHFGNPRGD